jgi:hypothetical protein
MTTSCDAAARALFDAGALLGAPIGVDAKGLKELRYGAISRAKERVTLATTGDRRRFKHPTESEICNCGQSAQAVSLHHAARRVRIILSP